MKTQAPRLLRIDLLFGALVASAAFLIYWRTLAPSLSRMSPDGAELATVPYILGLAHSPGYPLYTWIGKLFTLIPVGDVAYRMNLMSATMAALAAGGVYLIGVQLLHPLTASSLLRRIAASLAAMLLAFSRTFWSQAVIAEVYAPNAALIAFTLLALLHWEQTRKDRHFFLFSLAFGLSLGTHLSNLGFAPGFLAFILLANHRSMKRPAWWLAGALGFGLGVIQFIWLPFRSATLHDQMMLARSPTTLRGLYQYTLGAFHNLRFAFPLTALPDRLVIYLELLRQQFSIIGIVGGIIGLISLLVRRPRYYYLLVGMYLVHVWFFIQYRAFDLEVFFLPAHLFWALFLAAGAAETLGGLEKLFARLMGKEWSNTSRWALALGTFSLIALPLALNWSANERSKDVALNDFYANLWELLPEESVLLTRSGVFGYEAFYWRLVYDTRQDVALPALTGHGLSRCDPETKSVYATSGVIEPERPGRPGDRSPCALPQNLWQVPILVGGEIEGWRGSRGPMVLYRLENRAPDLISEMKPGADAPLADLGGAKILGAEIEPGEVESGGRVHLRLYWEVDDPARPYIEIEVGGVKLEGHEIGFGNLPRYRGEVGTTEGKVIVEQYWLVIPSTMPAGDQKLAVSLPDSSRSFTVGQITVLNHQEAMERWLEVAGR